MADGADDHIKVKPYPIAWAVDCPWCETMIRIQAEEDGEPLPEDQFIDCPSYGCGCLIEVAIDDHAVSQTAQGL